jgi:hypothetical protein
MVRWEEFCSAVFDATLPPSSRLSAVSRLAPLPPPLAMGADAEVDPLTSDDF